MLRKILVLLIGSFILFACNDSIEYSNYQDINNGIWAKDRPVVFELPSLDSLRQYHVFIQLRNDNRYSFSNLFLITELEHPDGKTIKDTLQYKMADVNGEWLGKGLGSIKENRLWYKEAIVFEESGVYTVTISHAMRKNGEVEGLSNLEGVTDVGLQIEKADP